MITKEQALKALDKLLTAAKTNDDNKFHHFDKFKRYNETIRTYIEQQDITKIEKMKKDHPFVEGEDLFLSAHEVNIHAVGYNQAIDDIQSYGYICALEPIEGTVTNYNVSEHDVVLKRGDTK